MPRANSVSGTCAASSVAIAPKAVRWPVSTTSTRALPLLTDVPANTQLPRRASGASAAATPGAFSTGNDSPVRLASETRKSRAASTIPSAGTRLPAARSTTSPGTSVLAGTVCSAPSRSTRAVRASRCRSAVTAAEARYSWAKPSATLPSTIARMIAASSQSRRTSETAAPAMRIRTSGLASWWRNSSHTACSGSSSKLLAPWRSSRRAASPPARPRSDEASAAQVAAAGSLQYAIRASSVAIASTAPRGPRPGPATRRPVPRSTRGQRPRAGVTSPC